MKKQSKNQPLKKRKEFRFHKVEFINDLGDDVSIKHPAYVFLKKGNVYIFVTLTHSSNVSNHLVIELKQNPNSKDKEKSYWVCEIKEDTKDRFGKVLTKWKIDDSDDLLIRQFFERSKK